MTTWVNFKKNTTQEKILVSDAYGIKPLGSSEMTEF
jgi:hypothetical protein